MATHARNRRGARRLRGLTALEVAISAAVVSGLVLAASTASVRAIDVTADVVSADAAAGSERRVVDRLAELLLSASRATLEGIPSQQGSVAEPLQEGVDYADLRFRRVVGFVDGDVAFEPAPGNAPYRVERRAQTQGREALVLIAGAAETILIEEVAGATFRLDGNRLTLTLERGDYRHTVTTSADFVLRVP